MPSMADRIPIVDLLSLGLGTEEPTEQDMKEVGKELVDAFSDIGFVYIKDHGIPDETVASVNDQSEDFFEMSDSVKKEYTRGVTDIQGYTGLAQEKLSTNGRKELRESFDVNDKEGAFPDDLLPQFRSSVIELVDKLMDLTRRMLTALEHGMDLPKGHLVDCHDGMFKGANATTMRILYYPPIQAQANPKEGGEEGETRCAAHTDYGTLTILHQDTTGGLEVKDCCGDWVEAQPMEGALLVNVGDLLQKWTRGRLQATVHRVQITKESLQSSKARRSIAFFVHPDNSTLISALDGSSPPSSPLSAKQHVDSRFRETYG